MIDLGKFADGAVAERFNIELQKVLENIADPNTDAKKARTVTIAVTLKADENRDIASVSIQTKTGLSPAKGIETKIVMDYGANGMVVGNELKSGKKGQLYIDVEGDLAEDIGTKVTNVVDYKAAQGGRQS